MICIILHIYRNGSSPECPSNRGSGHRSERLNAFRYEVAHDLKVAPLCYHSPGLFGLLQTLRRVKGCRDFLPANRFGYGLGSFTRRVMEFHHI